MRFSIAHTLFPIALAATMVSLPPMLQAQSDEPAIFTQTLLRVDSKAGLSPTMSTTTIEVNGKKTQLHSLTPVQPNGVQIALLIDDGLRRSVAVQLQDIEKFITGLPAGTEILVGYMANGTVKVVTPFTTDHVEAAKSIRIPFGIPGLSASPYFCLSEFVKQWPGNSENAEAGPQSGTKARFALMITNGVDPYNGSTSVLNQDSPYVQRAIADAQRAGVPVYSIYYGDAGIRGGSANFSGQSYLRQIADATGGDTFYQGYGEPVALQPFFQDFTREISETYIASFDANTDKEGRDHLVRLKVNTSMPKLKIRHADEIRPGNHEAGAPVERVGLNN